ncbi:MAG TPA: NAD(P)H-hydrate dehydratase [Candidatus Acidoferrales bacterium]
MKILTAAEMREVDRLSTERAGVPSIELMENAGRSVAEFIQARWPDFARRRIVVFCGKGNNGGDGFVVARHLKQMGAEPEVVLCGSPEEVSGDAAENLKRWQTFPGALRVIKSEEEWDKAGISFTSREIIVDALLGTGMRGEVSGVLKRVIHGVNARRANRSEIVAVDIPSGLIADTGEHPGETITADYTVTFTAPKIGMLLRDAPTRVGTLVVREIGSPAKLTEETGKGELRWLEARDFEAFAAPRKAAGNKGDYGHALIVAGSVGKTGAAVLASWAALRVGAGLVTVATPETALPVIAAHTPEIMTEPLAPTAAGTVSMRSMENGYFESLLERKRALAIGPGLTTQQETQEFIRVAVGMRSGPRIILDADGLNAFAGRAGELKQSRPIVITPHPGEMARLVGGSVPEVQANRLSLAKKTAAAWHAIVVLKGQQTVIAAPDGRMAVNSTGNPGMATGGTGDVLTGMLAGLTAEFSAADWFQTICFGVYLHGLAGDVAYEEQDEAPLMASDLIRAIPRALAKFRKELDRG